MLKKFFKHIVIINLIIILYLICIYVVFINNIELCPNKTINSSWNLNSEIKKEIKLASSKYSHDGYRYDIPPILETSIQYQYDDVEGCCAFIEDLVCNELIFSFKKKQDRELNEQNCFGHAAMMTEACNYAFKINGINAKAYHVRGDVKCFGISICNIMDIFGPFFKDHDFVVVKYNGKNFIYDASLRI